MPISTLPEPDALARLITALAARPALWVLNEPAGQGSRRPRRADSGPSSWPPKAAGGLDDWKTAICGQLYAMPAARARAFRLPIGLPVEDGFLRAMVLTDHLTGPEDFTRIDGLDGLRHLYAAKVTSAGPDPPSGAHRDRLAINAALFAHLRRLARRRPRRRTAPAGM